MPLMMTLMNFLLAATIVVGLVDGKQVAIENPKFNGFIETRDDGQTVLFYRQKDFHGEMPLDNIQRIDIGYKRGKPYPLTITLKNGQKMIVESDKRNYITLKGQSPDGAIAIQHPDPISPPTHLSSRAPNRKKNLTIKYLELPR